MRLAVLDHSWVLNESGTNFLLGPEEYLFGKKEKKQQKLPGITLTYLSTWFLLYDPDAPHRATGTSNKSLWFFMDLI
jgi:hypothetical protein